MNYEVRHDALVLAAIGGAVVLVFIGLTAAGAWVALSWVR